MINIKSKIILIFKFGIKKININLLINTIILLILRCGIISLIYTEIPIVWNINTYLDISEKIGLTFGLLEYKSHLKVCRYGDIMFYINNGFNVALTNYRCNILGGFKSITVMVILVCIIVFFLFIFDNIFFLILSLLGMVLVKALMLNFYKKHFVFTFNPKNKGNIVNIIRNIFMNKKLLLFLFKLWILSIIMAILVRSPIFAMLPLSKDSIIAHGLAVTLPLPIFYYLLNFVIKYIKKEAIKQEDYYLYNDFVANRVNIYRIIYVVCINFLVRNYYYHYLMIMFIITLSGLFLFVFVFARLPIPPATKGGILLQSKFEITSLLLSTLVSISPILQQACNEGYTEYFFNQGTAKYIGWKKLCFSRPGLLVRQGTVNWLENVRKNNRLYLDPTDGVGQARIDESKLRIEKSPILNIAYRIKNNFATSKYQSPSPWHIRPINFFENKDFYGCVSLALHNRNGRFMIVCIVRRDLNGTIFIPTYHLPDLVENPDIPEMPRKPNHLDSKVIETVNLLESKYGISIPKEEGVRQTPTRQNGLIIFTQADSLDIPGLYKIWRPSLYFTIPELNHPKVKDYFHLDKNDIAHRHSNFNYQGRINEIKTLARRNLMVDEEKEANFRKIALNEYKADRALKYLAKRYFTHGVRCADSKKLIFYELIRDPWIQHSFFELLKMARKGAYLPPEREYNEMFKGEHADFDDTYKKLMIEYSRFISNNHYVDRTEGIALQTRRDMSIPYWLTGITKTDYVGIFNIFKKGVIEGFKEQGQYLGKYDSEFILPLHDSRLDLIKTIASWAGHRSDVKGVYGISVNRLTFEFLEVLPNNKWAALEKNSIWELQGLDWDGGEVFSYIDLTNSYTMPVTFIDRVEDWSIPKHDFNLFDDKDEHSIRKMMDLIYNLNGGKLVYNSPYANSEEYTKKTTYVQVKIGDIDRELYPSKKVTGPKKKVQWGDLFVRLISDKEPGFGPEKQTKIGNIGTKSNNNVRPKVKQVVKASSQASAPLSIKGKEVMRASDASQSSWDMDASQSSQITVNQQVLDSANEDSEDNDMILAKLASIASFNKTIIRFDDTFTKRGWLDTLLDHTHAKDAAMAGPSGWKEVYPVTGNIITIPNNSATDNIITIPDNTATDNIITISDNPATDNAITISSDESSELSSDTSDEDSSPERNLESFASVAPTAPAPVQANVDRDETLPDLSGGDLGGDLDDTLPDLSGGDLGGDITNNEESSASPEEDNRWNRSSNPSPEEENDRNRWSDSDVDMTENDRNEVVSRSPVFLDFDPCGYDTDLHGHFLPPSPHSVNSQENVNDQENNEENLHDQNTHIENSDQNVYSENSDQNVYSENSDQNGDNENVSMPMNTGDKDNLDSDGDVSMDAPHEDKDNLDSDGDVNMDAPHEDAPHKDNLDSDGDVSMGSDGDAFMNAPHENRNDNSDSDAMPLFLDFDPCGYDTDLHGHFLPPSPHSVNSQENVNDQENNEENNTDEDGDTPM